MNKNFWDHVVENGNTYQMGEQKHRIFLLDLLKKIGVVTLLDVGCGTAPLYQIIRDNFEKYQFGYKGVDYSNNMIEVCKKEFPNGRFAVEDARRLKELDNSWHAVVLLHSLDHLDDYEKAIKEAARVASTYVAIVLWRPLTQGENNLNSHNDMDRKEGAWEDTHLQEYAMNNLLTAFKKAKLKLELEYSGEEINEKGQSNRLFLLKKYV